MISDAIIAVLALHHTLWQVKGLSLTLNHIHPAANPAKSTADVHNFFYLFLALVITRPVLSAALGLFPDSQLTKFIEPVAAFTSISMIAMCTYFFRQKIIARDYRHALFSTRLLAFALIPISKYGFLVALSIHGIEYLFVTLQLFSNQSRRFIVTTIAGLIGIATFLRLIVWEFNQIPPGSPAPLWLLVPQSFALTIGLAHYYWDRVFFAMKAPETREFTGELLRTS